MFAELVLQLSVLHVCISKRLEKKPKKKKKKEGDKWQANAWASRDVMFYKKLI
jgi:hypothetical protein